MELRFLAAVFFTIVLLGAITCLTGCATSGMDGVKTEVAQCGINTGCTTGCDLEATTKTGTGP